MAKIVGLANGRCDQENVIEQLKNGVNAMRMPVDDLVSNWAYMVMAALAWNLKAWYGLLVPDRERGLELVRMEFRRFLQAILLIPCQVVRTAQRVIYRVLGYNSLAERFLCDVGAVAKAGVGGIGAGTGTLFKNTLTDGVSLRLVNNRSLNSISSENDRDRACQEPIRRCHIVTGMLRRLTPTNYAAPLLAFHHSLVSGLVQCQTDLIWSGAICKSASVVYLPSRRWAIAG